jgi:all-trans-8'-apo-beta-carotenal 15,15'-oxygenase
MQTTDIHAFSAPDRRSVACTASWHGGFQDLTREHGFERLRVTGRLPPELRGTLYRNGPGRFGVGRERYPHWFDGDGAVCAIRLTGDAAFGAHRLVRTSGLEREEQSGRRLFGGYGTPLARPIREGLLGDFKQPANTSVLLWQGRLFATCEAGKPYELGRGDLSTLGETSLEGTLVGPFSAHPHAVPARGAIYGYGVGHRRGNSQVDCYVLPSSGLPSRIASFALDGMRLIHDFAATERHLVFVVAPQYLSIADMLFFGRAPVPSAKWRAARGTEIVVVPIDAPSLVRRFRVDAFYLEHVVNAFDDGDSIVVDYVHYADPSGLEQFVGGLTSGRVDGALRSEVRCARIDVDRETLKSEVLLARSVELPRVSPLVEGRNYRFAYSLEFSAKPGSANAMPGPFGPLVKHDLDSGRVNTYDPGHNCHLGEGIFVPRSADAASGDEDDGWVLAMVYDAPADRSRLEILDARDIGAGPLAACWFDHPVPFGFHGMFAR